MAAKLSKMKRARPFAELSMLDRQAAIDRNRLLIARDAKWIGPVRIAFRKWMEERYVEIRGLKIVGIGAGPAVLRDSVQMNAVIKNPEEWLRKEKLGRIGILAPEIYQYLHSRIRVTGNRVGRRLVQILSGPEPGNAVTREITKVFDAYEDEAIARMNKALRPFKNDDVMRRIFIKGGATFTRSGAISRLPDFNKLKQKDYEA